MSTYLGEKEKLYSQVKCTVCGESFKYYCQHNGICKKCRYKTAQERTLQKLQEIINDRKNSRTD